MSIASEANTVRAKAAVKASRDAEKSSIQALMKTVDGRKWIWDMLSYGSAFNPLPSNPQDMAIAEGERRSTLRLLAAVTRHTPALYITMTQENTGLTLEDQADD